MLSNKKTEKSDSSSQRVEKPRSGFKADVITESSTTKEKNSEQEEADSQKFDELLKKYYKISRDIRMSALLEEKKELEKMIKSPAQKYYEGSREDRLQALEEERELMEKLNDISEEKKLRRSLPTT